MKLLGAFFAGVVAAGANEVCYLPIDLMFVQDTTGSFVEDLPNVSKNIPLIIQSLSAEHPGSKFGISQFKDKPYRDLGEPDDYCYKLNQPLTATVEDFQKSWDQLYASGGGDIPEAQLQAIINVATDPSANWRKIDNTIREISDEFVGARLLVVSTDAVNHDTLDYELYLEEPLPEAPLPPAFMPPFPANFATLSSDTLCRVYDYPTFEQAAQVVKDNQLIVVFLVPEVETAAVAKWQKFNTEYLNQPANFVQYISSDSSDIVEVLLKAVAAVSEYVCNSTTTTTTTTPGAPTTTPATTTTTTTPATTATTTTTTTAATTTTTTPATTTTTTVATTTPVTTTTTTTAATTVITTPEPTTTPPIVVTTAGTPETTTGPVSVTTTSIPATTVTTLPTTTAAPPTTASTTAQDCVCPPNGHCECSPALVVRVNHRPKSLVINYEK